MAHPDTPSAPPGIGAALSLAARIAQHGLRCPLAPAPAQPLSCASAPASVPAAFAALTPPAFLA